VRPLTTAVWYPSQDSTAAYNYRKEIVDGVAVQGRVAEEDGPYPLLIFAHGFGSCGLQAVFLTEHLASQGYIVAAPDFHDGEAHFCTIKGGVADRRLTGILRSLREFRGERIKLAEFRPDGVSALIDWFADSNSNPDSPFFQAVDLERIGVFGHSFGGWTATVVAGAMEEYYDPRVKAIVSLAGQVGPLTKQDFSQIKIPSLYMYGVRDATDFGVSDQRRRVAYDWSGTPKHLITIKNANHFIFTDRQACGEYGTLSDCQDKSEAVQLINTYITSFFDYYLRADPQAKQVLKEKLPLVEDFESEW
jgi:predicted dienelactone hydrolase